MTQPRPPRGLAAETRAQEAAQGLLEARTREVDQGVRALLARISPDGVHDTRVALRRLRAAIGFFDPRGRLASVDEHLKILQTGLGTLRELHVHQAALRERVKEGQTAAHAFRLRLIDAVGTELSGREEALRSLLRDWRSHTSTEVRKGLQSLQVRGKLGGHRSRARLRQAWKKVQKRADAALPRLEPLPAHRLRIAGKGFRYQLELLVPVLPEGPALLKAIRRLQNALGDLHDTDARRVWLTEAIDRLPASEGPSPQVTSALWRQLDVERRERATRAKQALRELRGTTLPQWLT
jgi:CHAD domain-containing protein